MTTIEEETMLRIVGMHEHSNDKLAVKLITILNYFLEIETGTTLEAMYKYSAFVQSILLESELDKFLDLQKKFIMGKRNVMDERKQEQDKREKSLIDDR